MITSLMEPIIKRLMKPTLAQEMAKDGLIVNFGEKPPTRPLESEFRLERGLYQ